jgi:hypothetical protein
MPLAYIERVSSKNTYENTLFHLTSVALVTFSYRTEIVNLLREYFLGT